MMSVPSHDPPRHPISPSQRPRHMRSCRSPGAPRHCRCHCSAPCCYRPGTSTLERERSNSLLTMVTGAITYLVGVIYSGYSQVIYHQLPVISISSILIPYITRSLQLVCRVGTIHITGSRQITTIIPEILTYSRPVVSNILPVISYKL